MYDFESNVDRKGPMKLYTSSFKLLCLLTKASYITTKRLKIDMNRFKI